MKLHILGICGTFMGSLALLAREMGHHVSGSDQNVYPPMSTQLSDAGIELTSGWDPAGLPNDCDLVIIGNALSRGNPAVEHVLESGLRYCSGPQWLGDEVLRERKVIAVAGTHGKTTTACMVAHLLESCGASPGFLIGGVPGNFNRSARLGAGDWFVVEADEYDTAFFDKRSKFVHYHPTIALLNNLEFDHADIFPDLAAIQTQFHHLLRLVPRSGVVIAPEDSDALTEVLERGLWCRVIRIGQGTAWQANFTAPDQSSFALETPDTRIEGRWSLSGQHNLQNALAAICSCDAAGFSVTQAAAALDTFELPKRRQQLLVEYKGVRIIDDFAHHPTAIAATLEGLAAARPQSRLIVVLEPRSNTMKLGIHADRLPAALKLADRVWLYAAPDLQWDTEAFEQALHGRSSIVSELNKLPETLAAHLKPGDQLVFMSNGGFGGVARETARVWTAT
ncbi:MAG: UDP-N-acetylmuramate:L-alanyl-gamma-D-glutamyl-meso-diaminopimelate ligase [Pseudomonadota bacterium]